MGNFCTRCGKELNYNARFCANCGNDLSGTSNINNAKGLLKQLSDRYLTNGIIWIVVAAIQIIIGITINWVCLIVGVLNLISGIQNINFSKSMLANPNGIIDKVRPLAGAIIVLIYNVIFGGVLGVAGSIYYLVGIRSFALSNENEFRALETNSQAENAA